MKRSSAPKAAEPVPVPVAAEPVQPALKAGPLAPQLKPMVAASVQRVAKLEAEVAGLSLGDVLNEGDAPDRRKRLVQELHEARAERDRLVAAFSTAQDRDERAANEVELARLQVELTEFERITAARRDAARELDKAAEAMAAAWHRLRATSQLLEACVPDGCHLPQGFRATNLTQLARSTIYRNSNVANPGDEATALPGGSPPSIATRYDPGAIPSAAETIGDECSWLVSAIKAQIELTAKFKRAELPEVAA
jgi:hypothetical protein